MNLFWTIVNVLAVMSVFWLTGRTVSGEQPNVILIYGDDVGYGDVGVYGSELIPTPNIDRLAVDGIRFTDAHATAATCTPSRFSMLTGVYGFRHDVRILPPNAPLTIPTDWFTLPRVFKEAGYHTAVIGKWHLGLGERGRRVDWNDEVKPGPLEIGFDHSFLLPSTNDRVPCVYLDGHRVLNLDPEDPLFVGSKIPDDPRSTVYPDGRQDRAAMTYYESSHGHDNSVINGIGRIGYMRGGESALWNDETMADEFVSQSRAYIKAHQSEPFFLYFASQDIHVPRVPHPRFRGATKLDYRGDAMVQLDWSVGQILEFLDEYDLAKNTIVIFASDNGPVYDDGYKDGTTVKTSQSEVDRGHDGSGLYRGGKYQIYEGGTRVPLIIRWPRRIEPRTSGALVSQIDFIASFAELLGVELPDGAALDSRNTLNTFLGESLEGLPFTIEEAGNKLALRKEQWKYVAAYKPKDDRVDPRSAELYDVKEDPGETVNVIEEHTDIAGQMLSELSHLVSAGHIRQ